MSTTTPAEGFSRHAPGPSEDLVPGVISVRTLAPADAEVAAVVYVFEAGAVVGPDHHGRREIGYVLDGELRDENAIYPAGTLFVAEAGTTHHPRTDTGATVLIINTGPAV
jgi:quercetin dioxygenase-like cupin family protein